MKLDIEKAENMSSAEIEKYLSPKEIAFGREYLKDGNATAAAIRAGYSERRNSAAVQGARMLKKEKVRAYRHALIREQMKNKDLTKESIVLKLSEIVDRCMQNIPVTEYNHDTKQYEETGEYEFDSRGAIRALNSLTKILGFDAPVKVETTVSGFEAFAEEDPEY